MKDDGTLSLRGEQTPLMRLFLARRSARRYAPGPLPAGAPDRVLAAARTFARAAGLEAPRLEIVGDGPAFDAVIRAAMRGLVGKINPWLAFTEARHLLLCGAVYRPAGDRAGVERAVAEASMAMEAAVLAATAEGLATCWIAGLNHDEVERAHPLPDGARLVAMSPLGLPAPSKGLSWDAVAFHVTSKRRKPLEELWMRERWGGPA